MGKYALLIGVDTYGEGLQPLPAAPKDVAALREVLLNPEMGGFDQAEALLNPNQPEMAQAIELWFQDRQPEDLVLLFFSGHGVKDDRRDLYFAAADTRKNRDRLVRSTATPARFLHDCIRGCKAKQQVLILDCCFSGAFGDLVGKDDGEIPLKEQLGAEGRVVLTSTSAVDYSFEEKGADLSIYTRYLVEGIATGAADEDGDGVITAEELHRYAGRKVEETSPAMSPQILIPQGEGYRIRLARSPQDDPKLKYRKEVEQRAVAVEFTPPAKRLLSRLRVELGLSEAEAEAINAEALKPHREYQRKRQEYQETLEECLDKESPLSPRTIQDLKDYRAHLQLKPEDMAALERSALNGQDLAAYTADLERQQQEAVQRKQQEREAAERQRKEAEAERQRQAEAQRQREEAERKRQAEAQRQREEEAEQKRQAETATAERQRQAEAAAVETERQRQVEAERQREEAQRKRQQTDFYSDGVHHLRNGNYEQAIADFRKAQDLGHPDAGRQLAEVKRQKVAEESELDSEKGVNYNHLRDLLKAKKWREADEETYQLMIRVMDKESSTWFTKIEFLTFPSIDLNTINNLWIKYSQGRFGFSVQKKIYLECGALLNGEYPGNSIWHKFCTKVGWRNDNRYASYEYLMASLSSSPFGEFPWKFISLGGGHNSRLGGWWEEWQCVGGGGGSLFSHKDLQLEPQVEERKRQAEAAAQDDLSNEKGIDYTRLRDLLKAGEWRDADEETYEVMIRFVGRKSGDWFDSEELLNFPCTDLRAIDRLWVKYSNGKFGFSVQKKIYVECGAKLDGQYPGDKIWREFCDRVGWRKDGIYLNKSDLQANPSISPGGEFPFSVLGAPREGREGLWGRWVVRWWSVRLFSRIKTCKL